MKIVITKNLFILFTVLLTACTAVPVNEKNMSVNQQASSYVRSVFNKNIYVAAKGEKFNKLEVAIRNSLYSMNLLSTTPSQSYVLTVEILADKPPSAYETNGYLTAKYNINDSTGKSIFNFQSYGYYDSGITLTMSGIERRNSIIEGYARSNIENFLNALDSTAEKIYKNRIDSNRNEQNENLNKIKMSKFFLEYDIFSEIPFTVKYPTSVYGAYDFKAVAQYSTSNLSNRIDSANLEQIKTLKKNYYSLLDSYFQGKIDSKIASFEKNQFVSKNTTKSTSPSPKVKETKNNKGFANPF